MFESLRVIVVGLLVHFSKPLQHLRLLDPPPKLPLKMFPKVQIWTEDLAKVNQARR